jgi:hypothetical protein
MIQGLTPSQLRLFEYVEDGDLWAWKLPDSHAFHAGIGALGLEYDTEKNPGIFDQLLLLTPDQVISSGAAVLEEQGRQVREAAGRAYQVELGGGTRGWGRCAQLLCVGNARHTHAHTHVLCTPNHTELTWFLHSTALCYSASMPEDDFVCTAYLLTYLCTEGISGRIICTHPTHPLLLCRCLAVGIDSSLSHLRSQLGNELAMLSAAAGLRGVGVVAYREAEMRDPTQIKVSLRSLGEEDTTVISEAYGGGGHQNASSFVIGILEFERWQVGRDDV